MLNIIPHQLLLLLTVHERNIIGLMSEGFSSKQIAHRLHICEQTVVNHRKNMLKKTETKNTIELVATCIRNNVIWENVGFHLCMSS